MDRTMLLISLAVAVGVAVLPPAVLGRGAGRFAGRWALAGGSVAIGFVLAPHPVAGVFAVPWLMAAATELVARARAVVAQRRVDLPEIGELAAAGFLLVAGVFALDSCIGRAWFGYGEPIARLTAVHFTYAGVGAVGLAVASLRSRPGPPWRCGGVLTLVAGMPLVAAGFATGFAVLQVGGPLLVSTGVYLVACAQLADGVRCRSGWLIVSGLSVWGPMGLAMAWALAPHTGGPALSIDAMVPLHGGGQALGFVLCGLAGRGLLPWAADRATERRRAGAAATVAT